MSAPFHGWERWLPLLLHQTAMVCFRRESLFFYGARQASCRWVSKQQVFCAGMEKSGAGFSGKCGKYVSDSRAREQGAQLVSDVLAVVGTTAVISAPTPIPAGLSRASAARAYPDKAEQNRGLCLQAVLPEVVSLSPFQGARQVS